MGSLNKNIQLILEFLKPPFLILHTFPRLITFLVLSVILRSMLRSTRPEVFLGKNVLKICSKFTVEHPCRSAISTKFLCNFIEITLRHGCSPVNLQHIFRTTSFKIPLDGCFCMLVIILSNLSVSWLLICVNK